MGLVAKKDDKPKVQRELAKKGPRPAILSGVIDVGVHVREFGGEMKHPAREFIPIFTLVQDTYTDDDGVEHNKVIAPYFPIKIFEGSDKSNYYKLIKAIDPDDKTMNDGQRDLTDLLGMKCYVMIEHNEKDGIFYANYRGVSEIPDDYPLPECVIDRVVFDTEEPDKAVFDKLWDSTKDQIRASEGYAGSQLEGICEGTMTAPADDDEDDIPF